MVFIIKNAAIDILSNLSIISGTFSSASFDATLASRIFHFLEGNEAGDKWAGIVRSLKQQDPVHDNYSQDFLNAFYTQQFEELLPEFGFRVDKISLFNYPNDTTAADQGHIGFIATKI